MLPDAHSFQCEYSRAATSVRNTVAIVWLDVRRMLDWMNGCNERLSNEPSEV